MSYLPWWASALALASVAVGFYLALGRSMGVSGGFGRVFRFREERRAEIADAQIESESELAAALEAATRDAFGDAATSNATGDAAPKAPARAPRLPVAGEVAFLVMIVVGAFAGALLRGTFSIRADLGPDFARLVGTGGRAVAALFAGGVLVGFGTRYAGGCTSGHGLSGCARFERGSLLATAVFLGTAILVSLGLEAAR